MTYIAFLSQQLQPQTRRVRPRSRRHPAPPRGEPTPPGSLLLPGFTNKLAWIETVSLLPSGMPPRFGLVWGFFLVVGGFGWFFFLIFLQVCGQSSVPASVVIDRLVCEGEREFKRRTRLFGGCCLVFFSQVFKSCTLFSGGVRIVSCTGRWMPCREKSLRVARRFAL